ncbi:hypothetical protein B0H10DRAFT_2243872 [Mycena sp. CBHHK59/15]|nr:hypothetical protein B0H10DRAFT_2243872 [Mycena sp. CBHHK59/15]
MASLGFPRQLIHWVASFLHHHTVTIVIDGVIVFLLTINHLLRRLKTIGVFTNWRKGFIDDSNFSTPSKSPYQNDEATFEDSKTELIHSSPGRTELSNYHVVFNNVVIRPSPVVKWIGVWIDNKLIGDVHIKERAVSAAQTLNAAM